ncbi:MAG: hypothetical protein EX263_09205 [Flavobacteriaceae bacterium]|nr:MAG: hypothetical protein EX263_09205 [Flavobacteriaceae bacterium]
MKLIDNILIFCVLLSVFFLAGFTFNGSEEKLLELKANLVQNLIKRASIFGLIGAAILYLLRFLFYAFFGNEENTPSSKYLLLTSLFYALIIAVGGSTYFLNS